MRSLVALLILLLHSAHASAQTAYVWTGTYWQPVQCAGGSCQGWGSPNCFGGYCQPQPQIQRPPSRPQPQVGGEQGGPVPQYEIRPRPNNPALPSPPPATTPTAPIAGPAGPQGPRGEQGPPGPAGKDGSDANCQCGDKWKALDDRLGKIEATLGSLSNQKPVEPPKPTAEKHIVVVADHNDPYWQRLSEEVTKTSEAFHGVQVAPTPRFDFGEKPQAVVYENSVPVRVVKGEQGVLDLLSRARRGMSF